jgi:hypothetical protein
MFKYLDAFTLYDVFGNVIILSVVFMKFRPVKLVVCPDTVVFNVSMAVVCPDTVVFIPGIVVVFKVSMAVVCPETVVFIAGIYTFKISLTEFYKEVRSRFASAVLNVVY